VNGYAAAFMSESLSNHMISKNRWRIIELDIVESSNVSPGNPFIWGQKVKGQGHEAQKKQCQRAFLHSCECRILLV